LLCAPRPIQRYMDHRDRTSFTEVRSSSMFVRLFFCDAVFSNFAEGYRPEFSKYQAENLNRQSARSNLKSCMELGAGTP